MTALRKAATATRPMTCAWNSSSGSAGAVGRLARVTTLALVLVVYLMEAKPF